MAWNKKILIELILILNSQVFQINHLKIMLPKPNLIQATKILLATKRILRTIIALAIFKNKIIKSRLVINLKRFFYFNSTN